MDWTDLFDGSKIAIVFCGSSRVEAPWSEQGRGWRMWSIPSNWKEFEKHPPDLWVDIHRDEVWQEQKGWHLDYQGWLQKNNRPVVMARAQPSIPTSVAYPFKEFDTHFPDAPVAGTVDWMMALALLGFTTLPSTQSDRPTIGLYGIDYETAHETVYQRWGAAYWCGVARGLGVTLVLPASCPLLKNPLPGRYGPDYPPWPVGHHPYQGRWHTLGNLYTRWDNRRF